MATTSLAAINQPTALAARRRGPPTDCGGPGFCRSGMVMARMAPGDEIAAVRRRCRDLGLGDVAPAVVQMAHRTTLRLPPLTLVALTHRCADLKSVCVAIWGAADPSRSAVMREAAAHHLDRARRW